MDAIVEERSTRPWDAGDTIDVIVGGWISVVLIWFGRTKKRLRCGRCSCQFARGVGLFTKVFWWTVVAAIAMFIAGGAAMLVQPTLPPGALPAVSGFCSWLAGEPLVALALLVALLLVMFFGAVIGHTNAGLERRHLHAALARREVAAVEQDAQPPAAEPSESLGRFYRR
ncbi:MAG TPA: hypothetical protein PKE29_01885 [Phycisphaerales bacterium]|nr:hypothetical protein [Phycisphaerales bacterium]